jgi:plasmanylethanolamine desaturase
MAMDMWGAVKQRDARELAGTDKVFRRVEVVCIVLFPFAWLTLLARTYTSLTPSFALVAIVVGLAAADFISGVAHWFFDTWFTPDTPFIGRAFVRTFREHHVDPTAICRHDFIETNGSNMLAGGVLVAVGHCLDTFGAAALLFAGLFMSMTSQIHKWAHAERVPRFVAVLQDVRLILPPRRHALHHVAPFDRDYCITSGWLNTTLHRVRFFHVLERTISAVTGALPRVDDIGQDAAARTMQSGDDVHGDAGIVVPTAE